MKKLLFLLMAVSLAFNVSAGRPKAKHVVLFAIDGWGGYSVPKAKNIPNIRKIMDSGCFTLHSRSTLPSSSAINWASMFMGAGTEMHGYTEWNSRTPEIPSFYVNERGIFPTIFSVIREQMPEAETGCLMEWVGIKYLIDSAAVNCVEVLDESQQSLLCERAERYILEKKPDFVAICYDQLDHTGHADGFDVPEYYTTLERIDTFLGRVIEATKKAGMFDDTIFILTGDHGGKDKGHGGKSLLEMEVPFIIAGKNVRQGGEFKEVNMRFDTAATIAYIFGLEQPQAWIGRPAVHVFK